MEPLTYPDVQTKVIGNPKPMLMIFYSQNEPKSMEALEKFKAKESEFPNIIFFACEVADANDQLCKHYGVKELPAVLLIVSGNSTGMFSNAEGFDEAEFNDVVEFIRDMV